METKEKEFKGLVINGFVALILFLALTALSVYGIVYFANHPTVLFDKSAKLYSCSFIFNEIFSGVARTII